MGKRYRKPSPPGADTARPIPKSCGQPHHLHSAPDLSSQSAESAQGAVHNFRICCGSNSDYPQLSGHGRAFTTDGYYIVPETVRGTVDRMAGVRFVTW